ncbi:MAG TPA: LysR substrate-binding domain-containing protein [Gemmatimonadales bacterium]|nr:LysR substrate-binding domain-containing protein [Gemmatimonadales bacterium]
MELRHLRYAVAVAEEGSFTHAAARLHVVQQALSQQIADLERELGVRIFERTSRGIRVTEPGAIFLAEAVATLANVDRTIDTVRHHAAGAPPTLRVGAGTLFRVAGPLVAEAIRRFREAAPAAQVEVLEHSPDVLIDALLAGQLDVAFTHVPPPAALASDPPDRVDRFLVWEEPWSAVLLPAQHPLATRHPLRLQDLAELPMILFPRQVNPVLHGRILTALEERGLSPVLAPVRISGMPAADLELVAGGVGWHLMVASARPYYRGVPGVAFRSLADDPIPRLALWVISRRADPSSLVTSFLAAVRAGQSARPAGPDAQRFLG